MKILFFFFLCLCETSLPCYWNNFKLLPISISTCINVILTSVLLWVTLPCSDNNIQKIFSFHQSFVELIVRLIPLFWIMILQQSLFKVFLLSSRGGILKILNYNYGLINGILGVKSMWERLLSLKMMRHRENFLFSCRYWILEN